jgi:hypothetical protein
MAAVATATNERRHESRAAGAGHQFGADAVLRPGHEVVVVNISRRGALVDSGSRLRPGAHGRVRVEGRLDRCQVVRLDPVRYRGVVVFDDDLDIGRGAVGSE